MKTLELQLEEVRQSLDELKRQHLALQDEYAAYQRYEVARAAVFLSLKAHFEDLQSHLQKIIELATQCSEQDILPSLKLLRAEVDRAPSDFLSYYLEKVNQRSGLGE